MASAGLSEWPAAKVERLRRYKAQRMSNKEMAAALGVRPTALVAQLKKQGLYEPHQTLAQRVDAFAEALAETGEIGEAADRVGVTRSAGYKYFKAICKGFGHGGWQAR